VSSSSVQKGFARASCNLAVAAIRRINAKAVLQFARRRQLVLSGAEVVCNSLMFIMVSLS